MKNKSMDEATSQGIRNGHTFVFMPGSRMIPLHGSSIMNIPGFDNSLEAIAGTDGVRINIHEPGTTPNPSLEVSSVLLVRPQTKRSLKT